MGQRPNDLVLVWPWLDAWKSRGGPGFMPTEVAEKGAVLDKLFFLYAAKGDACKPKD
jgi:hypothetical protein